MRQKRNNNEINCYGNRTKRKGQPGNHYNNRNRKNYVPIRTNNIRKGNRYAKRKLNKKRVALVAFIFIFLIALIVNAIIPDKTVETSADKTSNSEPEVEIKTESQTQQEEPKVKKEITDWKLMLANYENILPEDFEVEVVEIADDRLFDARAIADLKKMINAMGKDGISNIWVQSAYRSVERQKELYDKSVKGYLDEGKSREEAERLTEEYINKPGASDHNLGLAVDFNNVDNNFEDLKGFKWLQENAENYGFILRYPKDKEDITKISYESWHWRYVGEEHAKKMNKLNMCLEEYIEHLQNEE